ncbi:MAG TPA: DNA modification methylase, partial [Patescibacteria group bacterium]|nr:DNA modification methylase [Patescibacteria group bacterium]
PKHISVEYLPIGNLRPADYNPRSWDDSAKETLKKSIEKHGFVDPVIVNSAQERKNVIIGGHFRVECAKELGFTEVPVVFINIPEIEKEKELNLRLNRNTGQWDFELLKQFDTNFLVDIGFDDGDLSKIWSDVLSVEDDNFDEEKTLQEIKNPTTQPGDIFALGSHRLICGDSTDVNVVKKLVEENQIDMVYSDPPYNINLDYSRGVATTGKYGGSTKDNKNDKDYAKFLSQTISNALTVIKKDAHVFYWCDQKYIGLLQTLYGELGVNNKRVCLWIKNNFNMTPHIAFNKAYEPCVYGTIGSPYINPDITNLHEVLNKDINAGNRTLDDIIDVFDIWLAKRVNGQDYEHPTQKPLTLTEKPLRRCTRPGDNVLDLFGGSGITLLACEQMKRKAFICEIEPIFCDLIIRRFEALTGIKAKKLNN